MIRIDTAIFLQKKLSILLSLITGVLGKGWWCRKSKLMESGENY